jgi:hypothetical protein
MRKGLRILQILLAAVSALLAFVFILIEGYGVVSADWLLHERPGIGLMQTVLRFALAAGAMMTSVSVMRRKCSVYMSLCCAAACTVLALSVPNGFGVLFAALSYAVLLTALLLRTGK